MSYSHMILGRALVAGLNQPRQGRRWDTSHNPADVAAFERASKRDVFALLRPAAPRPALPLAAE